MVLSKYWLLFCFLLTGVVVSAQGDQNNDTIKTAIQAQLVEAKANFRVNNKTGEALAYKVYEAAKNNPAYLVYFIDVHNLLALYKMDTENYNAAGDFLTTGLKLAIDNNQKVLENKIKGNLGLLLFRKSEYQKCIIATLELLPQLSGVGKASALGNIAASYNYLNQYDLSIKYQHEALAIFKENNNAPGIATGYNLLGASYTKLKKPNQAIPYLIASYKIKKENGDTLGLINTLINLGENSYDLNNYSKAYKYFNEAEILCKAIKNKEGLSKIYTNLGVIASKQNNFTGAKEYELKAVKLAKETKDNYVLNEVYANLSKTYKEVDQLDSALISKDKAMAAKDSMIDITVQQQIAEMQTKYETVKKEKQIEEQKFSIDKRNYIIAASTGFILLAGLAGLAFFNRFRLKKKSELQQKLNEQQQKATIDILTAEEKERKRIASDLHDGVGQLMTAAWLNLQALDKQHITINKETSQLLAKTIHLVDESCKEVRAVSHNMMPNALLKKGLVNAVKEFISQINTKSTKINLQTDGLNTALPTHVETVLYRVIQESVNNVIKHAAATSLDISINQDDAGIDLMIEDNGKGFVLEEAMQKDGIGLHNIKSRVDFLKGTVEWSTTANKGTLVAIHIPV
jgi:two-component system, NarL family, sensor kinase